MANKKIAKNIKFEDALAELEEQVRLLEVDSFLWRIL